MTPIFQMLDTAGSQGLRVPPERRIHPVGPLLRDVHAPRDPGLWQDRHSRERTAQFWHEQLGRNSGVDRLSQAILRTPYGSFSKSNAPIQETYHSGELLLAMSAFEDGREMVRRILPLFADAAGPLARDIRIQVAPRSAGAEYLLPVIGSQSLLQAIEAAVQADFATLVSWIRRGLNPEASRESGSLFRALESVPEPQRVSVLSWNVWGMPRVLGGKASGRYPKIAAALQALQPDIIALQEMWDKKTATIYRQLGYPFMAQSSAAHKVRGGNGLMILSKFPIVATEEHAFSARKSIEKVTKKGGLLAKVRLPDGTILTIGNFHAASTSSFLSERRADDVRMSQLTEGSAWLRRFAGSSRLQFAVGDFNTDEQSRNYHLLKELFGRDLYRLRHPHTTAATAGAPESERVKDGFTFEPGRNRFASSPQKYPERLDYQFVRGLPDTPLIRARTLFVAEPETPEPLSDHSAVFSEISL